MAAMRHEEDHNPTEEVTLRTHERSLDTIRDGLAFWLPYALASDGPVTVDDLHVPDGGGLSSITVLCTATWRAGAQYHQRKLVTRLPPDTASFPVFPSYDLKTQHDVMAALVHSDVPVPIPIGFSDGSDKQNPLAGLPFLVMEHVNGHLPVDNPPYVFCGWLFDATPDQRRSVQDATLAIIARIHAIPDPLTTFPRLRPGGPDALRAHVTATRSYYEWIDLRVPILERAFDWLERHWPSDPGQPVLSWGDARPGNVIYEVLTPVAVLDWEMAAIAPREIDLGWYVFIHKFFQDIAQRFEQTGLPDMARPGDVVATYEACSGYRVRDLYWYVVYAAVRHGVVMSQIKLRMIHFGEDTTPNEPDNHVMHRALLEQLLAGNSSFEGWAPS